MPIPGNDPHVTPGFECHSLQKEEFGTLPQAFRQNCIEQPWANLGRSRLNDCLLEARIALSSHPNRGALPQPLTDMKLNRKAAGLVLAKGQIWKLQDSHIEILEMGKRLASYKHFRTLDNRRAPTQLANIASVQEMLTTHKAVLLDTKAGSAAIKKLTKKK